MHEKALVDDGARIGDGTRVWAFAHVMGGARIGRDCNIGNYAFVEAGARLGDKVTVQNGVLIWKGVIADDKVFFGPNCVLTNDMFPRSGLPRKESDWLLSTRFKEGASIGANATIVPGITVGRYAYVVAGAVATRDVPDHAMVKGCPARFHAWICKCGAKLAFRSGRASCACGESFRLSADGSSLREGATKRRTR